jgi:hypothetical protein
MHSVPMPRISRAKHVENWLAWKCLEENWREKIKHISNSLFPYFLRAFKKWSNLPEILGYAVFPKLLKWSSKDEVPVRTMKVYKGSRVLVLLILKLGTAGRWLVNSCPGRFTSDKRKPVPSEQEARPAPEPVWTSGSNKNHLHLYLMKYNLKIYMLLLLLLQIFVLAYQLQWQVVLLNTNLKFFKYRLNIPYLKYRNLKTSKIRNFWPPTWTQCCTDVDICK